MAFQGLVSYEDSDSDNEGQPIEFGNLPTADHKRPLSEACDELEDLVKKKKWEETEAPQPLKKKKSGVVKIMLPQICEPDSDDDNDSCESPATKGNAKKSAVTLLTLLPAPKTNKTLRLPSAALAASRTDVLPKATSSTTSKMLLLPRSVQKKEPVDATVSAEKTQASHHFAPAASNHAVDDEDNDDGDQSDADYLGLESVASENDGVEYDAASFSSQLTYGPCRPETTATSVSEGVSTIESAAHSSSSYAQAASYSATNEYYDPDAFDQETGVSYPQVRDLDPALLDQLPPDIQKTVIADGKARFDLQMMRGMGPIEVVDVSVDAVVAQNKQQLLRNITDTNTAPVTSSKKGQFTSRQKSKHQITYLAHMAKERESELQNQWAANRLTKQQTRAKYGF